MGNQISLCGSSGISFDLNEHELDAMFDIEAQKVQGGIAQAKGALSSGGWKFTITRTEGATDGRVNYWLSPDGFDWNDFRAAIQAFLSYYLGGFEAAPEEEWLQIARSDQPEWVMPLSHNEL